MTHMCKARLSSFYILLLIIFNAFPAVAVASVTTTKNMFSTITKATDESSVSGIGTADQLYRKCYEEVFETFDYEAAIDLCHEAIELYRMHENQQGEGLALKELGNAHYFSGDFEQALIYQQQALEIAQSIGDENLKAAVLNNLGNAYSASGEIERSIDFYQQSLELSIQLSNDRVEFISLHNLCTVHRSRMISYCYGKLPYLQEKLRNLESTLSEEREAALHDMIGNILIGIGQFSKAKEYYRKSIDIYRLIGDEDREGTALNQLGIAHRHLEEYEQAIELYSQALDIAIESGDNSLAAITYGNLGVVYGFIGRFDEAFKFQQQALMLYRELNHKEGEGLTLGNLGLVVEALGDYQKAISLYTQSLEVAQELEDGRRKGNALTNIARAQFFLGKYSLALEAVRKSLQVYERELRSRLSSDSAKVSIFDTYSRSYKLLQIILVAQNRFEEALEVSEQSRARTLVDILANRWQTSNPAEIGNVDTVNEAGASSLNRRDIVHLAQEENITFVEYSVINSKNNQLSLYIWAILPSGKIEFRTVRLEEFDSAGLAANPINEINNYSIYRGSENVSELGELVVDSRASVLVNDSGSNSKQLQDLHEILIEPIEDLLPTDSEAQVMFIPQGSLYLVPFAALQDRDGTYLLEKHTILIAPSIGAFNLANELRKARKSARSEKNALIVGNPSMPRVLIPDASDNLIQTQLPSLPGSRIEANEIAALLEVTPLTDEQATEALIKEKLPPAQVIHLATHGLLDYGDPRIYGTLDIPGAIALTPGNGEDGLLTSSEILDMDLQAELAVLSACDTGRGRITGDGIIGLSRSLLTAGVPSVVVSLWQVPDTPTAELMTEFYRQLSQGKNKAQALRQAMLITMEQHPEPRNWAAFTLIGSAD